MEEKILKLLGRSDYAPANVPELIRHLSLKPGQQQELQAVLLALEKKGKILRNKGNRYILSREADLIPGVISINRSGKGFVQPEETGASEITIPESSTATALNGDRVLVRLDSRSKGLHKSQEEEVTGCVVRVLQRKRTEFVGTFQRSKDFFFVIPDDPRIPHNIYVPEPRDVGRKARIGDKVIVEIEQWASRQTNPEGEVIEVLGAPDEEGVDMLSVLRHYDLPLHFPKEVLEEAQAIAKSRSLTDASPEDLKGRIDCRKHLVITIDPDDAKDFDDAICIKRLSKDRVVLWVHIADVSHYVKPGSKLDIEARKRGNSTYLVDRVIPMLPEALSNELCSLKPNVDRMTKCVEFLLSSTGAVLETKFYPAVIRSKRRFTYKEVLARLQEPPADDPIERMLHAAHEMAQRIRKTRFSNGSLDLDFPENKIRLNEEGRVIAIERIENDVSHQLIEEYMLLANEAVAGRLMNLKRPAVYRVHEAPKAKRLLQFREDVMAHRVPCGNLTLRGEVQKLLASFNTLPIGPALKIGFLRSLMRARYAVEPLGHYGLAKTKYTHFTSPIRRYADLIVHRVLFDELPSTQASLNEIASHISDTERNSSDAERDSKEVKLYAYLRAQLSTGKFQHYPAMVTDVKNFGFFVDVPTLGLSGMIHLSSYEHDFFMFDPNRNELFSKQSRRVIKLGSNMNVRIWRIDQAKKQVDFQEVPNEREIPFGRPTKAKPMGKPTSKTTGKSTFKSSAKRVPPERESRRKRQD